MKARNAIEKGLQRLAKMIPARQPDAVRARLPQDFPALLRGVLPHRCGGPQAGREEEAAQAFQTAIVLSRGRYVWAQFALGLLLCHEGNTPRQRPPSRHGLDVDGNSGHRSSLLEPHPFSPEPLSEEAEIKVLARPW